jgi:hypothetical protein
LLPTITSQVLRWWCRGGCLSISGNVANRFLDSLNILKDSASIKKTLAGAAADANRPVEGK